MSETVNSDITSESFDAQQVVEEISEGDSKAPAANIEADYETSKQFSTSPIDQTQAGAKAAEEATASQFAMPQPDELASTLDSTGNPDDYTQIAKNLSSIPDGSPSANTDDLYKKALEKGKAAE